MKLQVTQENLAKALGVVARVANARQTLPILANVLLKTVDNRLSVAATNLDIAMTQFIGAKIDKDGAITVPARLLQDLVASLPKGNLSLELNDNKLHLNTDKYQSVINGLPAEDFPVMPAIAGSAKWSMPAGELKAGLAQVVFAASADDARPILTAVYFHSDARSLSIAATDSYRLAEKKLPGVKNVNSLLVPATAIQDLLRVITEADQAVEVTHDDQQASFQTGNITLVTRLIEGNYPDYAKLIPKTFATTAKLRRDEFINITKVSSLFARESAGSITIKVNEDDKQISIKSIASQLGENTAEADAEARGNGEVTLNSRYLLEGLQAFDGPAVEFCFNGKLEPCVLRAPGGSDYTHIIMPLRS